MSTPLDRVRHWLAFAERLCRRPGFAVACGLLAIALVVPAARNSLQTEDHFHRAQGWTTHIYSRGSGDIGQNYVAKDAGLLPWIASDDLAISFFRPLASLSLSLDHQLFSPGSRWLYAQSFFWLGLLVFAAATLLRRVNSTWGGGALAALLYAVDDAHGLAVGWLAARHALMAAALSVVAMLLFDRSRRDGWRAGAWLCPAVFLLALLSSELAVSALGFFIAHGLLLDRAPVRGRLLATASYLVPLGIWAALYVLGGYGARGSGAYISPLNEPAEAARAVVLRLPWFLTGTFGIGPADAGAFVDDAGTAAWTATAALLAAIVVVMLSPVLKRSRAARFWLLALLLSGLVLCTSPPADRLLLLLSISGMALVDVLVGVLFAGAGNRLWRFAATVLALGWILLHAVVAPFLAARTAQALVGHNAGIELESGRLCDHVVPGKHLVVISTPSYYAGWLMVGLLRARGCPISHARVLYGGVDSPTIRRLNAHTLLIQSEAGFSSSPLDRVFRSEARRFSAGQGLQLTGLQVVVVAVTPRGKPRDVEFRFAWPIESGPLRFVAWNGEHYAPFEVPAVSVEKRLTGFGAPRDATAAPK